MPVDGILNIYKPIGRTSFSIVSELKRILRIKQIGHGGTLDPLATGILPVFLNRGTRMAEYMLEHPKTYVADVELGVVTTTYDREGEVVARGDYSPIETELVEDALAAFRGEISQVPPVFSAIKQNGQPLYRAAREGRMIDVAARQVIVYRLELLDFDPPHVRLEVECGRGTYIRSLAHDLGQALGCGASLSGLERTVYGPFTREGSMTVPDVDRAVGEDTWTAGLFPLDYVVKHWPRVCLTPDEIAQVINGQKMRWETINPQGRLCAYGDNGQLVALMQYDPEEELWRPHKVFK